MQGMHGPPPNMYGQQPPQRPMQPPGPPGPGGMLKPGAPSPQQFQNGQQQGDYMNQMSQQMGGMSLQNPQQQQFPPRQMMPPPQNAPAFGPPQPNMPSGQPPISQYQGSQPPTSQFNARPAAPSPQFGGMPPSSQYNAGPPPTSQFNAPPQQGMRPPMQPGMMAPSPQMGGPGPQQPPVSQYQPASGQNFPPTSQYSGAPPNQFSGPPGPGFNPGQGLSPNPQYGGHMPPPLGGSSAPAGMPPQAGPGMIPPGGPGGMPPRPGMMPGAPGSMPPYMSGPAGAPAAPKRLDPDQMPSPIQVMLEDQKLKSGVFATGQRGVVPPLVTTNFVAQDQGNSNPRFLRSTMYNVPVCGDMMKQCKIPFGLVCSPYAKLKQNEHQPPLVNLRELGPVRCKRCRAYMCSFMQFVEGGRRFTCPFCTCVTDVPQEYFAHLDHTGKRVDTYERAELCLGSFEYVATKDYCKNGVLPNPPAFIFMIDVSYNSVKSGLLHLICQHLREDILPHLPKEEGQEESEIRVGFVTYSNVLHFYNVKGSLVQPQMLVVGDVEDVFVPMVDGFLVKPSEADSVIQSLLEQLPEMFADSRDTEVVLGPIVQAGLDALKSAGCPGKLFVFHTSLPTFEAPGRLKTRDADRKLLGSDKEKTILTPQVPFYTTLGQDCVTHGCGVDLFLFPNSYIDVATIGEVSRLTGGDIYKYDYFTAESNGTRFINDLKAAVSKPIAFDCITRIRTSTGVRPTDFLGNFYMSNTTDIEAAVIDCDKAFCVEIKHDDKLEENDSVFIQVAMLYTSVSGQRRLRIHNLCLGVCSQMAELFKSIELDTLINFLSKAAIRNQLQKTPKETREIIMAQCAEMLACYRRNCSSQSAAGQLILPESMKLLPLYTNCIIKSDALQAGAEVTPDSRSYLLHLVNTLDVQSSVSFFYPRLLTVHDSDVNSESLPSPIRCSVERLLDTGAYILENGLSMFLWLGYNLNPEFIQDVFGVNSLAQINIESGLLLELDNPRSQRLNGIIKTLRSQRNRFMKLTIVRQRDKLEPWFNHFLVEDKGTNGSPSYVDYLCHIHKEIRGILN